MKYTLDLTSPEFTALLQAAERHLIAMSSVHRTLAERMGRGAPAVIDAGNSVAIADRVLNTLKVAKHTTLPDKAIPSPDNNNLSTPHSMQVGDDMPLVYGRPRNDPRNARRKTSNIARKPVNP